jgi:two-component system chemotaxis response regulator CheB
VANDPIVAIGASTGGTEALKDILRAMPFDAPGIVIVQHMPVGFTAAFAAHLADVCKMEVREAVNGDRVVRGRALLARGDRHLLVHRRGFELVVELSDAPPVCRHRPSVDVLFRSVADAMGAAAVGVILTGMGSDGADGLLTMKRAGAPPSPRTRARRWCSACPRRPSTAAPSTSSCRCRASRRGSCSSGFRPSQLAAARRAGR